MVTETCAYTCITILQRNPRKDGSSPSGPPAGKKPGIEILWHFSEDLNENQFFLWDKKLIENKNWAILLKSSKAVFPVIAAHCNQKGVSFPGEKVISALCGRDEKTVREGILYLENFPGFRWEYCTTKRGRRSKKFFLTFPPEKRGQ